MPHASTSDRLRSWAVPAAIGIAAVALVAYILWGSIHRSSPEPEPAAVQATPSTSVSPAPGGESQVVSPTEVDEPGEADYTVAERRDPDDPLAVGPTDAPVVLVVFTDYQCEFCAKWSEQTLPVMMQYVDDGALRIEWRDVNVYGSDSERAARAAYAAANQGHFWEYHHALYPNGTIRSPGELSEESLLTLAEQLSLDMPRFSADMSADVTETAVRRNQELGIELGAFSTPSFVIAGERLVGAQPTEVFVNAVERAYQEAAG